jgi:hypothetical protein
MRLKPGRESPPLAAPASGAAAAAAVGAAFPLISRYCTQKRHSGHVSMPVHAPFCGYVKRRHARRRFDEAAKTRWYHVAQRLARKQLGCACHNRLVTYAHALFRWAVRLPRRLFVTAARWKNATHLLSFTPTKPPQTNNEYSRRSREVVRGGLGGQRTNHNAHTHDTIPGFFGVVLLVKRQHE